ncbi:hypothetical protein D9615_008275 [Tricholomella constricta]|uniref:Uncharacterized protein n=1 Tax=Tricholomella constricta TaxID=117010 RepID=A0A8H5H358_9AGAR|nr:hypothetical protein D9615_008275 [Tricholomella constricta]
MSTSRSTSSNRDSNAIRASVFDVCLQLGALDDNSLVAEWMFNDPSTDSDSSSWNRNRRTRFQEVISSGWEVTEENGHTERNRRHFLPFSFKTSVFAARLRAGPRHQTGVVETRDQVTEEPSAREFEPGQVSLSRRSFFKRSVHKPVAPRASQVTPGRPAHGRVSTNPKSFFHRKNRCEGAPRYPPGDSTNSEATNPPSAPVLVSNPTAPDTQPADPPQSPQDLLEDGDDEWEEVEATPGSPLYPLNNKGINPPALFPHGDKNHHYPAAITNTEPEPDAEIDIRGATHHSLTFAFPRIMFRRASSRGSPSSQQKRASKASQKSQTPSPLPTPTPSPRKNLSILTGRANMKQKRGHHRGLSSSLPSSPFVLLTSDSSSTMPQPTSRIVFSAEDAPVRPTAQSLSEAQSRSMGYHNQFFVNGRVEGKEGRRPKSVSVPTPPPKREVVPFPAMKVST